MQKRKLYNILRIAVYCVGFPLLFLIGLISSMPFFKEPVYADSCANGILILLGIWAIVEIVRFSMKFALRKNRLLQTIITIIVAIIVMAVPMFVADAVLIKDYASNVANSSTIAVTFDKGDKIEVDGLGSVTLTADLDVPTTFFNAGFKTENYEYQVGWFKTITSKSKKSALYWKLLYNTDIYMYKTGIDKWLNYKDYKFNNYEEDTGDGLALGVMSMLNKEIDTLNNVVGLYYYNTQNSIAITPELQAAYDLACGKASDSTIIKSSMSLPALHKLKNDLETKPALYPFLAVRNYIYIFTGIIPFVYILIYFFGEKRLAAGENEVFDFSYLKKFKKSKKKDEAEIEIKEEDINE